ncbi:MAG: hypothetical protein LUH05_03170 [Candidatus Gastranaerophilales bacterium]|nr:hypothetical protein [Candidatus Gastranaerophilales bacterium]
MSDIKFNNGTATKDGMNFSGKIKDTLKNGDSILLEYQDGIIQTSKREGKKNISKTFEYLNGDKIVHTTSDGKTSTVNITKKIAEVKADIKKKEVEAFERDIEQLHAKWAEEAREWAEARAEAEKRAMLQSEVHRRSVLQAEAKKKANDAQALYNKPFEDALSNKSAKKSAEIFEQEKIEAAQRKYNKPFKDALSYKDAEESAEVFKEQFRREEEVIEKVANSLADHDDFSIPSPYQIAEYAKTYGYTPVDKTYKFSDGTSAHVIFEGSLLDIDDQGRLLQKVPVHFHSNTDKYKVSHNDITKKVSARLKEKEAESLKEKAAAYAEEIFEDYVEDYVFA